MSKKLIAKSLIALCLMLCATFVFADNSADLAVKQNILVEPVKGLSDDFIKGVDISSLADIEKAGGKYYNAQGEEADIFEILKENGVNWVRLRIWNNPTYAEDLYDAYGNLIAKKGEAYGGGNNSVEVDIPLAVRAKEAGLKLLLDFHYSDTWADPGKQNMPQDWVGLNEKNLNAAVEKYTKESLEAFIKAGARPDMVQIGNELNNGFMWPLGKIWGDAGEKVGGMDGFITLLKSAAKGVRSAQGNGEKIKIAIHLADGGNNGLYRSIFDPIKASKLDYDVIGLSFYTYWHGSTTDLKSNMTDLAKTYGKELIVMETAYAFTPEDGDDQGNVFQVYSNEKEGYVPSVQGQATAIADVIKTVASVKGGNGVFYWEPAWIPVEGAGLSATEGCTWENQSMFDFEGRVLPSLAVWNLVSGKGEVSNVWGGSAKNGSGFVPYSITDEIKLVAKPGETPKLPALVKLVYTNDSEKLAFVSWEKYDWSKTQKGDVVQVKAKLAGSKFAPVATVEVTTRENLIDDPSFESEQFGAWVLNGPSTACLLESNKSNAHTGNITYKYWLGTGFKSILSRKFTDIKNGTYTLSIWAMGGGGENTIRLFATDFDANNKEKQLTSIITNTGWQNWVQYKIDVPVTSGEITIGIYLDTNPGNWGNFDDVELYLNE